MYSMTQCLHCMLFISLVSRPSWALSVDILVKSEDTNECITEEICRQDLDSQSGSAIVSWIAYPNDLFIAAKYVHSSSGHTVLLTTTSSCRHSYMRAQSPNMSSYKTCSLKCSDFLDNNKQVFTKTIVFNSIHVSMPLFSHGLEQMERYNDRIVKAMHSILSREKWTNYILFSSTQEELTAVSAGIESSFNMMFTLDEETNLNQSLAGVYTLLGEEELNFIVFASRDYIKKLLHQAFLFETAMMKRSRWLVVPSEENFEEIVHTQTQTKTNDVVLVMFSKCSEEYPMLNVSNLVHLLTQVQNINPETRPQYMEDLHNQLTKRTQPVISTNVYLLQKTQNITSLVSAGHVGRNEVVLRDDLFTGGKYGFNNRTFIVAMLEWPPFVFRKEENGTVIYSGICVDVLSELAARLNFSYEIVEPEDGEFGRYLDGNWTGLVALLAYKKVDLVVAPLTIDASRETVIDFTIPFFFVNSAVMLKKPDPNANKWKTLVAPFRYEVYICILLTLIYSTVLLFVVEEVHPVNTWTDNSLTARRTRYGDILWYHFGALMANGGASLPNTQSGRTVLSCWWLFTVISAAIYSGNLIAFLSDWREKPPFSTLQEMIDQDIYHWGTVGGSVYIILFQESNRSDYQKIWNGMVADMATDPDVLSTNTSVHLDKVLASHYAYITDESILELWQAQNCDLFTLKEEFFLMGYGVGLHKNSVHTDVFSEQILKLSESGLIDLWYKKWMPKSHCETAVSAKRVDLFDLQSAFYACGVGITFALSVLITEYLYNKKCKRRFVKEASTADNGACDGSLETHM